MAEPESQTDLVIRSIKAMITTGVLGPGSRLPIEKDLAATLGVSRGSLREGIRALAMVGVLESRQGAGTYVTSLDAAQLMSPLGLLADLQTDANAAHLLAVRRVIEAETAAQSAVRMTLSDLAEAARILDGATAILDDDPDMDLEAHIEADAQFHRLIARTSGNPAFAAMIDSLLGHTFRARIWRSIVDRSSVRSAQEEHRGILEALRARDPERARQRMIEHVRAVEEFAFAHLDDPVLQEPTAALEARAREVGARDARVSGGPPHGPFDLHGRLAVVTGASRGIGFAMAEALARAGADIIAVSSTIDPEDSEIGRAVQALGRRFEAHRADLGDRAAVGAIAEVLAQRSPDVFVGNAGVIERSPAAEHPVEAWDHVIEVDLTSQFVLAQAVARPMLERGWGRIIFTASLLSFQGGINVPSYAAAKSGLAGLTRALSNEWAGRGVTVNAIAPGYIATDNTRPLRDDAERSAAILDRIPAGRWGIPDDIAGAAVFLAAPASGYVTGAIVPVDGGWLAR